MSSIAPIFLLDEFNVTSYFVGRHIKDGRADKVAIECGDARVTYRQLFERVNQVENTLRKLGVRWPRRSMARPLPWSEPSTIPGVASLSFV